MATIAKTSDGGIKLLIDECLSPELALMAREAGHVNASHVVWIGKSGWKDWEIKPFLLAEDWVFVTRNGVDFRGPHGQYADVMLHAGLICINGPMGMNLAPQRELFATLLEELDVDGDLTNQVLEISTQEGSATAELSRYGLPPT